MTGYWKGVMNWPIDGDWKCEVCEETHLLGEYFLEWGLAHGVCRCTNCHTEYRMRDKEGNVTDTPICTVKKEYMERVKVLWKKSKKVDEMTAEDFEEDK